MQEGLKVLASRPSMLVNACRAVYSLVYLSNPHLCSEEQAMCLASWWACNANGSRARHALPRLTSGTTAVLLLPQCQHVTRLTWLCVRQVAGTEEGVTEPEATFSACFGGAFLMWHPMKYASMLAEKMAQHGTKAWLVNTGWTGGRCAALAA